MRHFSISYADLTDYLETLKTEHSMFRGDIAKRIGCNESTIAMWVYRKAAVPKKYLPAFEELLTETGILVEKTRVGDIPFVVAGRVYGKDVFVTIPYEDSDCIAFEVPDSSLETESKGSIPDGAILVCKPLKKLEYSRIKTKQGFYVVQYDDKLIFRKVVSVGRTEIGFAAVSDLFDDVTLRIAQIEYLFRVVEVRYKV